MIVNVVDYDENWQEKYIVEEKAIKNILQEQLVNCFHIGSSSVKGLKAKPIIDILLVVENINELEKFSQQFEQLGYEIMGEFGIVGRRYFRKGGDNRSHQIHAFQFDNIFEIERHLVFRDYLREHVDVCEQYGAIKTTCAENNPQDIEGYNDGKEKFVHDLEQKAIKWYWSKR